MEHSLGFCVLALVVECFGQVPSHRERERVLWSQRSPVDRKHLTVDGLGFDVLALVG